jgi:23S rRNA (uracil1939-C5)-methyltransferase
MQLRTGDRLTVTIEKLVHGGNGLARQESRVIFVPEVLPGETVQAEIREVKKGVAFAQLLEVIHPSPHRISPPCKIYSECGGCQIQHIKDSIQPEIKTALILETLHRIGRITEVDLQPMISPPSAYGYRARTQLKVRRVGRQVRLGFYREGSHYHVPVEECLVLHPELNKTLKPLEQVLSEDRFGTLEPTSVHLNLSAASREVLIRILIDARSLDLKEMGEGLYRRLKEEIDSMAGLVLSPRHGLRLTFGRDFIEEHLGEFQYRISDGSFSQIGPEATNLLIEQVVRLADLAENERVLELHCGIGTISLPVAAHSAGLRGVDANRIAIDDARFNAEANRVKNVEFLCADAEQGLRQCLAEGRTYGRLILDPPREGLSNTAIDLIAQLAPSKIIYVSCETATLARDLRRLCDRKYRMGRIQPVDMFPQTAHMELVAEVLL